MQEAKLKNLTNIKTFWNDVRYLLENPAASVDFKGIAYWAQQLEKAQKELMY